MIRALHTLIARAIIAFLDRNREPICGDCHRPHRGGWR